MGLNPRMDEKRISAKQTSEEKMIAQKVVKAYEAVVA